MLSFCPLASGSNGNSCCVSSARTAVLIDAGLPGRTLEALMRENQLSPDALSAILVTHEHTDHIAGVGVLSRKYGLPVYANAATWAAMEPRIGEIRPQNIRVFETGQDFYIKDICVNPIPISHDAAEPVGYALMSGAGKLVMLTDLGFMPDYALDAAEYADCIVIESNHDVELVKNGPYPGQLKRRILSNRGHLSNEDCGKALVKLFSRGVRTAILGHLSKDNNNEALAMETVVEALRLSDIMEMKLSVARRAQ